MAQQLRITGEAQRREACSKDKSVRGKHAVNRNSVRGTHAVRTTVSEEKCNKNSAWRRGTAQPAVSGAVRATVSDAAQPAARATRLLRHDIIEVWGILGMVIPKSVLPCTALACAGASEHGQGTHAC
eukprot:1158893-Pelagomonas_calceolata.AAC.14